ncbi:MAG: ribonuclease D [Halioglobus sp.]|nr:ribonuclease D [Halioglobus sp.]
MNWQLIESDAALQHLLSQMTGSKVVMVDTEFMRRNTFYPEVALVQLCFVGDEAGSKTAWLIDPLTIEDTTPLAALFTDAAVLKVLHSASEDLEVFQRWLGVMPQPLFDTQRAAALLNIGFGMGYRALVQEICGVDIPKGETRSDWLQRPLTASQCEYAGLDVTWLLPVWRELYGQCERRDRLQWVLADGQDATATLGTDVDAYHKRIKTAWKLDRRQLGILSAVCKWREATAKSRDKPRGWIIDDPTCLWLALHDPDSTAALSDCQEMPPQVIRRYGEEILDVLAAQRTMDDARLPALLPPPLTAPQRDQVKRLKSQVRRMAAKLAVAPEALLASKDYELLLREAAGEEVDAPIQWQGWRRQVVLEPLRHFLREEMR